MIRDIMKQKNITKYRLAKNSGIPYSTVNDICSGRAQIEKCTAETVFRLSQALDVSMEELLEPYMKKRIDFELYKSNVCHRLKELGDEEFVIEILERDDIRKFYNIKWYAESFYLLAMLDYISRENKIPLCEDYDDLRKYKLKEMIYPAGIISMAAVSGNGNVKDQARKEAIPEFLRFNIVESEVRNVV